MELIKLLQVPSYRAAILREFPALAPPQELTLDELVVLFLAEHEVKVEPVDANILPSRLSGMFAGAAGPGFAVANAHLAHQKKGLALQQWTSWKQWAMAHADFPAFKEWHRLQQTMAADFQQNQWAQPEVRQRVAELVSDVDRRSRAEVRRTTKLAFVMVAVVAVVSVVASLPMMFGSGPQSAPSSAMGSSFVTPDR